MRLLTGALLCLVFALFLKAQDSAVDNAVSALQSGDLPGAERILQSALTSHPNDGAALEVLGVVLDQEKKFSEAGAVYQRALKIAPVPPSLWNNYGNHQLSVGNTKDAEAAFAKVLALEPRHPNASVQMARLALDRHSPAEASRFLDRLPPEILNRSDVSLLRLRADFGLHRDSEAGAILARASTAAKDSAPQTIAIAEALSAAGKYDQAESLFARALALQPRGFNALYELGLAAAHAGHNDHAREVLQRALDQQPENVGVLYDLAAVDLNLNRGEDSLELLTRARKLDPGRLDVQLLLARTAAQLGYFGDAVSAWESYLKLKPDDEIARREHAFAEMALPVNEAAALADLRAYNLKHPDDATGHYELAVAESPSEPDKALAELTRALALKPQFAAAHLVRGLLLYRQGKLQLSVLDYEKAATEEPDNPAILQRLGQNYLALYRSADALRVLRRAEKLAPQNADVLLQLARALTRAGNEVEAQGMFARYRQIGSTQQAVPHPAGLVDFLSLSPAEQLARYRKGVERTVQSNPENVEAEVRFLGLVLADGNLSEAHKVAAKIEALEPDASASADTVQELLGAQQFELAQEVLQRSAARGINSPELQLDSALAADRLVGPEAALKNMDLIEKTARTGDYYLALGQILEEVHRSTEADQALAQALRSNPQRVPLYRSTALVLLEHQRTAQALDFLEKAIRNIPQDPQLRLLKALTLAIDGRNSGSEFDSIENRWPEWSLAWLAHAYVLASTGDTKQSTAALETARALGAPGAAIAPVLTSPSERVSFLINALPVLFGS